MDLVVFFLLIAVACALLGIFAEGLKVLLVLAVIAFIASLVTRQRRL